MSENKKYFDALGINSNSSIEEIEKAYNTAKEAWKFDDSAPDELKEKSKAQLALIEEAYSALIVLFSDNQSN